MYVRFIDLKKIGIAFQRGGNVAKKKPGLVCFKKKSKKLFLR